MTMSLNNNKKIIIGTAQFIANYGIKNRKIKITKNKATTILKYCEKNKINILDTSDVYPCFKKFLPSYNLKNWKISLKISDDLFVKLFKKKRFTYFCNKILSKFKKKKIDYLFFHNTKSLLCKDGKNIYLEVQDLKKKGVIKKIGVSVYNLKEINNIIKNFRIDVIQIPFNVFDQRIKSERILKKLKSLKIEIHARSIFLQGLLLMKEKQLPKKFLMFDKHFKKWFQFYKKNKLSPLNECLNFAFNNTFIDKYVIGVDSIENLKEIINCKIKKNKRNYNNLKSENKFLIDPRTW
jgi:aryl-alcohol dehydrogenase-like predicted oxidoreductase